MYTRKDGFAKADFDPKTVVTIPNIVTLTRLIILPFILVSLSRNQNIQAFILILLAGFTDVLDGFLAKILHQATTFGKVLDPVVDKLFMMSILVYLYINREFPFWAFYCILALEIFIISGGFWMMRRHHKIPTSNICGKLAVTFLSVSMYLYMIDIDSINSFYINGLNFKVIIVFISIIFLILATINYGILSKKEILKNNGKKDD